MDATILQSALGLSHREYQVLDYIRSHRPRVVPCAEINDAVFGPYCSPNLARLNILRIRKKLGHAVLITVPGFGVRWGDAPVVEMLPRCPQCGRAIARYDDEWACYTCGASGARQELERHDLDVGRSPGAGERSGRPWTPDEEEFVRQHQDEMTNAQMGLLLQRSEGSVRGYLRTRNLGRKRYVLTKPRRPA